MDNQLAALLGGSGADANEEMRGSPRFTLLIRAASLVAHEGEFVCVVRDVSDTGLSVRLFHRLPKGDPIELHMPCGSVYVLKPVWERDNQAGFEFAEPVDVAKLIDEAGDYPKRGIRLGIHLPVTVSTLSERVEGVIENLSQQGARIESDGVFAINQTVTLKCDEALGEIRAKVRWRRDRHCGVVFDDTMTLGQFARLAAQLQCPLLLND